MSQVSVDLVVGAIDATVEFWPMVRDDPALAPEVARNLLALWGNLRRFPREAVPTDLAGSLDRSVNGDSQRLVEQLLNGEDLLSWRQQALRLERSWERARTADDVDEREDEAADLFELLDRVSLAVYGARRLQQFPPGDRRRQALKELRHQVRRCERFVLDHPTIFLSAGDLASDLLAACRPDLDEFDPALWETTLKHRALEEALEEIEAEEAAPLVPFIERDRDELVTFWMVMRPWAGISGTIGGIAAEPRGTAAEPQFAIAADSAQQRKPSLPRTTEITSRTGGKLVALVYRPDGGPLTIEFRSTDLQLQGHSIELVLGQRGAEVFRGNFPLQLDAEQVLTARHEVGSELDLSTEYDIRFGLVAPSSSDRTDEEAP